MSSGSYFPPPVRAVEIPKPHGGGIRLLGVPTIADRVAQTVVAMHLEERAEPRFHPDSYGYRPRKAAWTRLGVPAAVLEVRLGHRFGCPEVLRLGAVGPRRQSGGGGHRLRWVLLYVKRWLAAPLQLRTAPLASETRELRKGRYAQLRINRHMSSAGLCAVLACSSRSERG